MKDIHVVWFRRNLRLHDNPAFYSAVEASQSILNIYIHDDTFPEYFTTFHPPRAFLQECLECLDQELREVGGQLYIFKGSPSAVIRYLHEHLGIHTLHVDASREPAGFHRDMAIEDLILELGVSYIQHNCHSLWEPSDILRISGGVLPSTFKAFAQFTQVLGNPAPPLPAIDWQKVSFVAPLESITTSEFKLYEGVPSLNDLRLAFGIDDSTVMGSRKPLLIGGEKEALQLLNRRLQVEKAAFRKGLYRPNQARPDLLSDPLALSGAISFGALSVRLLYWKVHELYQVIRSRSLPNREPPPMDITGQLVWREFFYTVSRLAGSQFHRIQNNPLCLPIPWDEDPLALQRWKDGRTGYPFIDAGMRQLLTEGWLHHTVRSAVAMFLTRGNLWINWEHGMNHFMSYLIDCDWAINAGNWLWISSSAFEKILDTSVTIDPVLFGRRLEPSGDYIRRFVPELAGFTFEYIHEPWTAPLDVQQAANCIIGQDYPERMVVHEEVSAVNQQRMADYGRQLMAERMNQNPSVDVPMKDDAPKRPETLLLHHPFGGTTSITSRLLLNDKQNTNVDQQHGGRSVVMATDDLFPPMDLLFHTS